MTYTDLEGRTFVKILNFWALSSKMMKKYGPGWKKKTVKTYGFEQLFLNQYDKYGRKV